MVCLVHNSQILWLAAYAGAIIGLTMNNKYDPISGKVIPVFFHYAIPSVIGMLAATSAGVIDGIFIGNFVGATALAAINISLDYLFIVRLGWGIKGAAWATAIAEVCIFFILLSHWFSARCTLQRIPFLECHRDGWKDVLKAAYNGVSEFANEMSIGLITLLFNWVMITRMGVEGVAAFTIVSYMLYIGLEACYGISESLQPTVSKNFGAKQPQRIKLFLLTAVLSCFTVGVLVSGLFLFILKTVILRLI